MVTSFAFLVVFISTHCLLVQCTDLPTTSSQCNCCDQCDQSATVSKLLLDISNLLVVDDLVNATSSTTVNSTTMIDVVTTTTTIETTTQSISTTEQPSTTQHPSTTEHQSTTEKGSSTEHASTTSSDSTTTSASTTQSVATINYSSEIRDSPPAVISIIVDPLPNIESSSTPESLAPVNVPSISDYSSSNPTTTLSPFTKVALDTSTKMSVCPENCYLDITGVYCNCYQASETPVETSN